MYFGDAEITKDSLREFTDKVMKEISYLSVECEEYWQSKKLSVRFKKWTDKTRTGVRQRIETWRNNRKIRLLSRVKK